MSSASSSRICPVCDSPNSSISLFCAECGASLNVPDNGDTASVRSVDAGEPDSQATAAIAMPLSPGSSGSSSYGASGTTVTSAAAPAWAAPAGEEKAPWELDHPPATAYVSADPDRGMRGFYLGLVAVLLILAILLAWGWASVLDQAARDSIQDFFGFIG